MVNAKKKFIYYYYIILIITYGSYLIYENRLNEIEFEQSTKISQENIKKFILKHKTIDAIIIGGSNASVGLSAELLSELSAKNFYNLSESAEGKNDFDYFRKIDLQTSMLNRNKVGLIIYSTLQILNNSSRMNDNEFLENKEKITLMPDRSVGEMLKFKLFNFNKDLIAKNKEYGDRPLSKDFNKNILSFQFNKNSSINVIVKSLIYKKNNFRKLFPNSNFVVVSPTVYNTNPEFQNNFISKLSFELEKNEIEFISQSPISSNQDIWTDAVHLNSVGRKKRTIELYNLLKKQYNFKTSSLN